MQLAAFDGPSPKTFYKRKNLAKISYTTRVIANLVSNFVAISTEVGREKCNWQHSIAHLRKPFYKRKKNLAKIFYTTRVIANLVSNFVAILNEIGRGKCNWQHSMAHLWKPFYKRKNLAKIFYTTRVIANFVPNFVGIATGIDQKKSNWQRLIAHPRNSFHPYRFRQKISNKSFTKAELQWNLSEISLPWQQGSLGKNVVGGIRWSIFENLPINAKILQESLTRREL